MTSFKKISSNSLVLIVGFVLIISAYAKLFSTSDFAEIIKSYGLAKFSILAPIIVIFELVLGLHLIFFIRVKKSVLVALVTFVVFTILYSYGFLIKGIESCGCFGNFLSNFLDQPKVVFIRNILLILFCLVAYQTYENTSDQDLKLKKGIIYIVTICAIFISGYSYKSSVKISSLNKNKFINKTVDEIGLNQFYTFSEDSTYITIIFSYSCIHCLNTIANLNLYKEYNYIDNIVFLPLGTEQAKDQFHKNYKLNGVLVNELPEDISQISSVYPTILFIKNNSVIFVNEGAISAPLVFFRRNDLTLKKNNL